MTPKTEGRSGLVSRATPSTTDSRHVIKNDPLIGWFNLAQSTLAATEQKSIWRKGGKR